MKGVLVKMRDFSHMVEVITTLTRASQQLVMILYHMVHVTWFDQDQNGRGIITKIKALVLLCKIGYSVESTVLNL